jgi:uncharacterized protein YihD (DUF1040 family)
VLLNLRSLCVFLWCCRESALAAAAPVEQHAAYWRERALAKGQPFFPLPMHRNTLYQDRHSLAVARSALCQYFEHHPGAAASLPSAPVPTAAAPASAAAAVAPTSGAAYAATRAVARMRSLSSPAPASSGPSAGASAGASAPKGQEGLTPQPSGPRRAAAMRRSAAAATTSAASAAGASASASSAALLRRSGTLDLWEGGPVEWVAAGWALLVRLAKALPGRHGGQSAAVEQQRMMHQQNQQAGSGNNALAESLASRIDRDPELVDVAADGGLAPTAAMQSRAVLLAQDNLALPLPPALLTPAGKAARLASVETLCARLAGHCTLALLQLTQRLSQMAEQHHPHRTGHSGTGSLSDSTAVTSPFLPAEKVVADLEAVYAEFAAEAAAALAEAQWDVVHVDPNADPQALLHADSSAAFFDVHAEVRVAELFSRMAQFDDQCRSIVRPLRGRSLLQQRWFRTTLLVAGASYSAYWLSKADNRQALRVLAGEVVASAQSFYHEHLSGPIRTIIDELFYSRSSVIADEAALLDSREALKAMLGNFNARIATNPAALGRLPPDLRSADLQALASQLDMRTVSETLVRDVQKPLVSVVNGDLVECLLIQIAFLKKEILTAMGALDQVMKENQFNLQLMATVPAILVLGLVMAGSRSVARSFMSSQSHAETDFATAKTRARIVASSLQRLLLRASRQASPGRNTVFDTLGERRGFAQALGTYHSISRSVSDTHISNNSFYESVSDADARKNVRFNVDSSTSRAAGTASVDNPRGPSRSNLMSAPVTATATDHLHEHASYEFDDATDQIFPGLSADDVGALYLGLHRLNDFLASCKLRLYSLFFTRMAGPAASTMWAEWEETMRQLTDLSDPLISLWSRYELARTCATVIDKQG